MEHRLRSEEKFQAGLSSSCRYCERDGEDTVIISKENLCRLGVCIRKSELDVANLNSVFTWIKGTHQNEWPIMEKRGSTPESTLKVRYLQEYPTARLIIILGALNALNRNSTVLRIVRYATERLLVSF